jgi:hypothetical protein
MKTKIFFSLILAVLPSFSFATDCAAIKAKYWQCVRSSMTGASCKDEVSIPSECLSASGATTGKTPNKSNPSDYIPPSNSDFFNFGKEKSFSYPKNHKPKNPIKTVNVKDFSAKTYLETQEDVDDFTAKLKDELSKTVSEGKRVRLQYR